MSVILWNYFTTLIYSNATARLKYCPLLQLCVSDSLSFLTESITEGSCFFKNLNEKHARSAWECNIQFYNVCAIYFCSLVVQDEKQTGFWRRCWTLHVFVLKKKKSYAVFCGMCCSASWWILDTQRKKFVQRNDKLLYFDYMNVTASCVCVCVFAQKNFLFIEWLYLL